ncbi:UNKNOWN [Stylonychia lemnae]|uniref:F5/8 type C domain-containing protein n=1 Tax=Stylonychia lemnae TaxID=5949 RepID=A0A078AK87_STYLE|nr:UNKNOWN [Stylonychia lemnae]|eukprot:CDW82599.1 UNKNOWN [Stylonychia lemnae]
MGVTQSRDKQVTIENPKYQAALIPKGQKIAAVASGFPVTASSEWEANHSAQRARLNYSNAREGSTCWCAGHNDLNQWIQVCLIIPRLVTGLAIQGRGSQSDLQWVLKYKLMYSNDGINWQDHENGKEHDGTNSPDSINNKHFKEPFIATTVRIVPTEWHGHISMRFEVYFNDL